ncbi:MAG: alpha-glucosidase/alpha-galactosidase [Lachnospiraceae bacterium]|nr:alpha-glucosidase/alpha-galactosidase [Lachnospiraceae bacterium]
MRINGKKAEDLQIAYIGGGSRGWAWTFMTDLAMDDTLSGTIRLYDIDQAAAKANECIGNHLTARPDSVGDWKYVVKDTLEEALTGADFVIISILPKTFDEMAVDVHMPERLGIYQSVGDTAGPGGMMRAMRTLPLFAGFARAIRQYCPQAWVINYTNPMSLCVKTLYHVFPEIKAFGCCHEVFGTQKVLALVAEQALGCAPINRREIEVNVLGINHFTWIDYASCQGIDLMPIWKKYVDEHYEEGLDEKDHNWANSSFNCAHRVKMDLTRRYGVLAAAGDRHLAEFMPGDEYLKDPETVKSWKFSLTTVDWRKQDLKDRLARSARLVSGEEEIPLEPTGEEGILLIKALCGLGRVVSNVNLPNSAGQISNLPQAAVVETNALFERDRIRPIYAGALTPEIHELIRPHVENHERVLQAALEGDAELLVQAFLNDPLVKGRAGEPEVRELVADMLKATM